MSITLKAYFAVLAIFFFATYNALREYFRTMEMSIVAGFWVVSFLLIMTPGPTGPTLLAPELMDAAWSRR